MYRVFSCWEGLVRERRSEWWEVGIVVEERWIGVVVEGEV